MFLYCDHPADVGKGGETVIADVRDIYHDLDKSLVTKLLDHGVRYQCYQPSKRNAKYKSWEEVGKTYVVRLIRKSLSEEVH